MTNGDFHWISAIVFRLVWFNCFLGIGCDDALLHASITSMPCTLSKSVGYLRRTEHRKPSSHSLFSTVRSKCDFGDIMRFTLETCRWPFAQRHAKFGK